MKYVLNQQEFEQLKHIKVFEFTENNEQKNQILQTIGQSVRAIRLSKSISLKELAYRINKDPQSIHRLEMGQINASIFYLCEIAFGLDVKLSTILSCIDNIGGLIT